MTIASSTNTYESFVEFKGRSGIDDLDTYCGKALAANEQFWFGLGLESDV